MTPEVTDGVDLSDQAVVSAVDEAGYPAEGKDLGSRDLRALRTRLPIAGIRTVPDTVKETSAFTTQQPYRWLRQAS